ncbi:MAG: porin [bacterium]
MKCKKLNYLSIVPAFFCFLFLNTLFLSADEGNKDIVNVNGKIEIDYENTDEANSPSQIKPGAIEVGIGISPAENVSGNILLRPDAEADNNGDILDEATITIEKLQNSPLTLTAGKTVMPFGIFNSHLISDPQTKNWETNQTGLIIAYPTGVVTFEAAIYDNQDPTSDAIGYATKISAAPIEGLNASISYKAESDQTADDEILSDLSANVEYTLGQMTLEAEYVGASGRPSGNSKPTTYFGSIAYQTADPLEIAAKYEGYKDDDSTADGIKSIVAGGINYRLAENTTLSFEYSVTSYDVADSVNGTFCKLTLEY